MIERNLGNLERVVRFILGVSIIAWAFLTPSLTVTEVFVSCIGLMLILNGMFSRCYAWYLLNLNTTDNKDVDCA